MKISSYTINFNKIKNLNFKSNGFVGFNDLSDRFERQCPKYSFSEQAESIRKLDDKIDILKHRLCEIRSSKGENRSEINSLKREIQVLKDNKADLISKFNSNVAPLYNKNNSSRKVADYLLLHKEIIPIGLLNKSDDETMGKLWRSNRFFIVNDTPSGAYIDSSYELNKENFKRLSNQDLANFYEIKQRYDISYDEIQMGLKNGYFKPLTLKDILTNEEVPVGLLNLDDKDNIENLENFKKPHAVSDLLPVENNGYVSVACLVELGYGSEKALIEALKNYKITGIIKKTQTEQGVVSEIQIAHNHPDNKLFLNNLRHNNKNVLSLNKFLKTAGISLIEFKDAVRKGDIQPIPYYIYPEDKNKVFINLKNAKNVDFMYKKILENAIIRGKCGKNDSSNIRLTFALCKNTRAIGNSILPNYPRLKNIIEKRKKQSVCAEDLAQIKEFSNTLWQMAGVEEYKNAAKRAKLALSELTRRGIDKVSDNEIKEIILKR